MDIKLKNETGTLLEINGEEYKRTLIFTAGHGITMRYVNVNDPSKTHTLRKDRIQKQNPDVARVLFDANNWING